jgi:DNA-binding PadR family transcriptional regulator
VDVAKRFFRHGELHLVILVLLSGRELNGYELMSELARLFGPAYRPSPGSVYPAMKALAGEDLIATDAHGSSYTATEAGRGAVEDRRAELALLEARTGVELSDRLGADDGVGRALDRLTSTVRAAVDRVDAAHLVRAVEDCAERVDRLQPDTSDGMAGHG